MILNMDFGYGLRALLSSKPVLEKKEFVFMLTRAVRTEREKTSKYILLFISYEMI